MKKILIIIWTLLPILSFAGFFSGDESLKTDAVNKVEPKVEIQYELAVCSVDAKVKKNPLYYHLASINTQLLCDVSNDTRSGTLGAFYNENWRLLQVVSVDNRLSTKNKTVPYSLLYLERVKPKK